MVNVRATPTDPDRQEFEFSTKNLKIKTFRFDPAVRYAMKSLNGSWICESMMFEKLKSCHYCLKKCCDRNVQDA